MIHPTAVIDKNARLDENVEIGAYTVIRENVSIGSKTVIGPHVVVEPNVSIGSGCRIFQFSSIGAVPQDLKYKGEETFVRIEDRTVIREFATINKGTRLGGGITHVGSDCLIMAYVHIAHDCKIGNHVILANCATLAGHIKINDFVSVGGLTAIHQFVRIGDHAYIGGASAVVKDVPPYVLASGNRAKLEGLNKIGLKRRGFSDETINTVKKAYRILFRGQLPRNEALEKVAAEVEQTREVVNFTDFIRESERGVTR